MSSSAPAPVTFAVDADGVGWITLEDPEGRANVLNPSTQAALAAAIDAAARAAVRAVVVLSAKERIFVAGADLKLLAALPHAAAATKFSRDGQALFQRLAEFSVPVVCAIHGACAGGGFELALACHWRIASDAPVTQIGLPETSLGTIPGWGGCVRLPRLIGVKPALEHILKGQLVGASEALRAGLVHEVAPADELKRRAKTQALKLAAEGHPVPPMPPAVPGALHELRETIRARTGGHLPALLAAIDAVEQTETLPIADGLEIEARIFGEVTAGETCKNLIRVFFLREAAKKRTLEGWYATKARQRPALPAIRRVGIVGAGVMGSGIAQLVAARGLEVVLRDVQPEIVERGMTVVRALFDQAVTRGKLTAGEANAALHHIATTTQWDGFESCDLVIEAIVENTNAKRALFSELTRVARPDALLASNTSALPIEEIAGGVTAPERTLGIHFFNPVSRMPLVELILAPATSQESAERALAFVKSLGKSPVICRSSPGFLVTRVLFFYLNAAVRLWEEGVSTAELDAAMRDFGWPMGPLRLIDEVGVDVTEFIFGEMAHYFPQRFEKSSVCAQMVAAGLLGRKSGTSRGFYRYEGKGECVNEAEVVPLLTERATLNSSSPARERGDIAAQLMRVMIDEAQRCLDEGIVKSPDDVDFALLSGAGFPAFRGGLMHWARTRR